MMTKAPQRFNFISAPQSRRAFHAPYFDTFKVDGSTQLLDLLQQMDIQPSATATECFAHVDGATARAVASIEDWISYLPADCVRAMILDGWHWST